jgi:hypothetical protein
MGCEDGSLQTTENRRSLHNLWLCKGEWKGQRGIYGAMALEGARGE